MIRNLTPHVINLHLPDGSVLAYEVGGKAPRVTEVPTPVGTIGGMPLVQSTFGPVVDLPEFVPGEFLIVSAMVANAAVDRADLVSPGDLVRDAAGRIIGCRALIAGAGMVRALDV